MKILIMTFTITLCLNLKALGQTTQVINENLQVTGSLDVEGNAASYGTIPGSLAPGLNQIFTPVIPNGQTAPTSGTVSWDVNMSTAGYSWRRLNNAGNGWQNGLTLTMSPTGVSTLKLFGSDPNTNALTLIAGSTSASSIIPGGLQVNGSFFWSLATQNLLPNQTLNNSASILTLTLGDGRYLRRSDGQSIPTLVFGAGSSAIQSGSIALGAGAVANGGSQTPSIAIGKNVTTTASTDGYGSMVLGWNSQAGTSANSRAVALGDSARALGARSLAFGHDAQTSSYNTVAIGTLAVASEGFAQAFGYNTQSSGYFSTALGANVLANGFAQTVVGYNNIRDNTAHALDRVDTENVFVVGNGLNTPPYTQSNAFTLKWNGDGWVQGNFTTGKSLSVTQDAAITGDASIEGSLEAGKASFSDTVRIAPRGGISMGEFTYDPESPPSGN